MPHDLIDALVTALAAEGETIARCLAIYGEPRSTDADRAPALAAYERASDRVVALLDLAVAEPAPGLLAALLAAEDAAFWRRGLAATDAAYAIGCHAWDTMLLRVRRVETEIAQPYYLACIARLLEELSHASTPVF